MTTPATTPADPFEAIRDALDDLAGFVNERYAGYPDDDRRFVRDSLVVQRAHAALDALATPSPGKAEAEDAARWRHAREAFWVNGDPADVLCLNEADAAIDAAMERDPQ